MGRTTKISNLGLTMLDAAVTRAIFRRDSVYLEVILDQLYEYATQVRQALRDIAIEEENSE